MTARATLLVAAAWIVGLSTIPGTAFGAVAGAEDGTDGVPRLDPSKVVTAESCGECHASAYDTWQGTKHATGFQTTHRAQNAYDIAERMGSRLIKRDSMCLDCHYTPIREEGELRAASGVSCESCHGAGEDYINVHNDYGGKDADGKDLDHRTESAEHRAQRIAAARAAGMRRPSDLYALVSTCYGCHTVPNEKLVNVGRHSLGTGDFDLVARSLEIRHAFLDSYLNGDGTVNAPPSREHLRRLAVIGRMLAVEHALRGLAEATTEDGVYFKSVERRLRRATTDLYQVARAAELDEADAVVTVALAVDPRPGEPQRFTQAARQVGEQARAFLDSHDGSRLAAVDPLLDGGELPFVELPSAEPDEVDEGIAVAAGASDGPGAGPGEAALASADTNPTSEVIPAVDAIPAEGEPRSHIRPRSSHDTLEVSACQKCHGDQNAWWFQDRHYASIEPFLDRNPKNVQIARLYGISPSRMARGDSLCMDCHGTVAAGRAARAAEDGVSCQSCHGPAADYVELHQAEEGEALGPDRPGYRQALRAGMKDLRDLPTAVANCASCHYVNDRRLLSSGHPSGQDFDIASAMGKIRHWKTAVMPAADLRQAWAAVRSERGPVPEVRLARLAVPARTVRTATASSTAGPEPATPPGLAASGEIAAGGTDGGPGVDLGDDLRVHDVQRARPAELPERPEIDPDASVDEVLRTLQRRLQELYRATGGSARAAESTNSADEGDDG